MISSVMTNGAEAALRCSVPCILSSLLVALLCHQLGGIDYLCAVCQKRSKSVIIALLILERNETKPGYGQCPSATDSNLRLVGARQPPAPPQGGALAVLLSCSRLAVAARGTDQSRAKSINPLLTKSSGLRFPVSRLPRHHTCPCHQIMSLSFNRRHRETSRFPRCFPIYPQLPQSPFLHCPPLSPSHDPLPETLLVPLVPCPPSPPPPVRSSPGHCPSDMHPRPPFSRKTASSRAEPTPPALAISTSASNHTN